MNIVLLIISFLISVILTPVLSIMAILSDWTTGTVDHPAEKRWSNKDVPLSGGVAIWISFIVVWIIQASLFKDMSVLVIPASLMGFMGLMDDLKAMTAWNKLMFQIAVSYIAVCYGLRCDWFNSYNDLISVCWLVFITNSFNLIDNIDGLSAGIAVIALLFIGGPVAFILAGALIGFLRWNKYPAHVYMGDCGSYFVGFMIAGMTLLNDWKFSVILLFVPIFDVCFVCIRRTINGTSIFQGDRRHLSHFLVTSLRLSERKAVVTLWVTGLIAGGTAWIFYS